jgi:hypothetical protein
MVQGERKEPTTAHRHFQTLPTMSAAKETLDIDRPDTLLLIGSTLNQLFKDEDGGTAFNVRSCQLTYSKSLTTPQLSKMNFALDQSMLSDCSSPLDGNSVSSDRL